MLSSKLKRREEANMQKKRMGLVALVIMALMVSSVAAWTILNWTNVTVANYSVKETEATWQAYVEGSSWDWVSPPLTLDLGELNGAETGSASGYIKLTVTTYARVNVTFSIGTDSALGGLQSWTVKIYRGEEFCGELTSTYPEAVSDFPSGSLGYEYFVEVSGTAIDYAQTPITGYINLYALVETAPL
jgi:hypothetical protein